jgi:RecJ-like exonuclease
MTKEQRGELWSMCRDQLAFAVTVCESHPYEMISSKLDAIARGLADDIEAMLNGEREPDDDDEYDWLKMCPECGGMGIVPDDGTNQGECDMCDGTGQVEDNG